VILYFNEQILHKSWSLPYRNKWFPFDKMDQRSTFLHWPSKRNHSSRKQRPTKNFASISHTGRLRHRTTSYCSTTARLGDNFLDCYGTFFDFHLRLLDFLQYGCYFPRDVSHRLEDKKLPEYNARIRCKTKDQYHYRYKQSDPSFYFWNGLLYTDESSPYDIYSFRLNLLPLGYGNHGLLF